MGNRAVVCFANEDEVVPFRKDGVEALHGFVAVNHYRVGVYLHWNGGRDSIEAFCKACKDAGFRGPVSDDYGVARFVQTVCNFIGVDSGLSVGVNTLAHLDCDNGDNGVYVVDDDWQIVGREFAHGEQRAYDVDDFVTELLALMERVKEACKVGSK